MNTHFPSITELQQNYPIYTPRSLEKPEKGHYSEEDQYYIKAGTIDIYQDDTAWKVGRVFMALGATLLALCLFPLLIPSFTKLLHKVWREVESGEERVSLYILESGAFQKSSGTQESQPEKYQSSTVKDPTLDKVESDADYSHLVNLGTLSKEQLIALFPKPHGDNAKQAEIKQKLSHIKKEVIWRAES